MEASKSVWTVTCMAVLIAGTALASSASMTITDPSGEPLVNPGSGPPFVAAPCPATDFQQGELHQVDEHAVRVTFTVDDLRTDCPTASPDRQTYYYEFRFTTSAWDESYFQLFTETAGENSTARLVLYNTGGTPKVIGLAPDIDPEAGTVSFDVPLEFAPLPWKDIWFDSSMDHCVAGCMRFSESALALYADRMPDTGTASFP